MPHSSCPRYGRALLLITAIAACRGTEAAPVGAFRHVPSPAAGNSGESNLAVDATGTIHMTWLERLPDSSVALRYARRSGDTWEATRTVTQRRDLFVNWADFPAVSTTTSGRILVHWLQRSTAGKYSYDAMLVQSTDRGMSWSDPVRLHTDSSASEHGFVSFVAMNDSAMAFWLDGRATGTGEHQEHGAMQVRGVPISRDGTLGMERALDTRSCDCCQTAAAVTSRGPIVAYRDRSSEEVRDIVTTRFDGTTWTPPTKVHDDGWTIDACPVNGPAIVAKGDSVVISWFTGARDTAKVQVAFSGDAGATFGAPLRIDAGKPAGRVALTRNEDGSVIVAWIERTQGDVAEIRVRRVTPDGRLSQSVVVTRSSAARASGFPRLARVASRLYATWTEPGDTARVRVAVADLDAR